MNLRFGWVRLLIVATGALAATAPLHGQQIDDLEFVNAPVRDILVALGSVTGNSVIPDETVTGTASFYFANTDFESAMAVLASRFNLFVTRAESVISVSAILVTTNERGHFNVDAPSADVGVLLRRLSREAELPVLFNRLPAMNITYHVRDAALHPGELFGRGLVHKIQDNDFEIAFFLPCFLEARMAALCRGPLRFTGCGGCPITIPGRCVSGADNNEVSRHD